ncbi:aminotransferase class IV [Pseudocnuella soli]|uniref:aminotransferase class IV n=1 Tax=Pseudocnuella soli TaxID=2502779 RepID=UPI00104A7AD2|nr:aminotransferase class IV [Pseudocnuella soli]
MGFICFNGQLLPAGQPVIAAANPGFRYGEGLFETMKMLQGNILLFSPHCQRLHQGMSLLGLKPLSTSNNSIADQVKMLAQKNGCLEMARIRWTVYRQEDGTAGYVLEAFALENEAFRWQERGWQLGLYAENTKATGTLANLKSANYLVYRLAAAAAAQQGADECIVLNAHGHVCDGSRTNIFTLKNGLLQTPPLTSGCVAGVMRRHVLHSCSANNIPFAEKDLLPDDLLAADEVFLTNAIQGIRWVSHYQGKEYGNAFTKSLYKQLLAADYQKAL